MKNRTNTSLFASCFRKQKQILGCNGCLDFLVASLHTEHNYYKYICIYHPHAHTHTQNTPPTGAVVDNSLYSTPNASVGIVVFMLKQQEMTSTEIVYGACLAAD